jgi:hypothetical protein
MRRSITLILLVAAMSALPLAFSCRKPTEEEAQKSDTATETAPGGTVTGEAARPSEPEAAPEEAPAAEATPAPESTEAPKSSDEEVDAGEKPDKDEDKAEVPPSPDDPSLETILSRYYDAIGGPGKWTDVKTMKYTGKMNSMGKVFSTAIVYKRPDKCRIDFSLGHIYFIQSFDGKEAWKFNPTDGSKPAVLEGDDANDLIETCDFDGPLIDHKAKGHKIEYLGRETVDGREGFKLKITNKTGSVDYYYVDTKTYLPFLVKGKAILKEKEVDSTTSVGDYIDTGGIIIPYYFEFDLEGLDENEKFKVSTVEINPVLEDSIFTFPRRIEDSY